MRDDSVHVGVKWLVLYFCLVGLIASSSALLSSADERPNFLFILTDDQSADTLGCYGNKICQTPNIDRIASRGILIQDAHHMGAWTGAVCTASRTMIMTGKSVWRLPNYQGQKPANSKTAKASKSQREKKAAQSSLPAVFNAAGYETFRTCKVGNSFNAANELFQHRHDSTMREGSKDKGSAWHGEKVMEYLEQRETDNNDTPFFIFFGFSHPHDPRMGDPELLMRYGAENCKQPPTALNPFAPPLPINYLPQHPFHHGHPGLRDEVNVPGVLRDRSEVTVRNEIGREYACIENIDRQVGRVLDQLQQMGELENTYVIFTSDHGIAVGRHGLMGKQNLYEHTWKVPFLVAGPGVQPKTSASGFIYLMDILPTVCDLAGIAPPAELDGESFASVLQGKSERIRDVVYGVYSGGTKPGIRSVKTADGWKLVKHDVLDGYVRRNQVFDLNANPLELLAEHHDPNVVGMTKNTPLKHQRNLVSNEEVESQLRGLNAKLKEQMKKYGDPYLLWDQ